MRNKVTEGRKLLAKDFGGTSDPYFILEFGDLKYRSAAINKTLTPIWLEEHAFSVKDKNLALAVHVWDKDSTSHDDHVCNSQFFIGNLSK